MAPRPGCPHTGPGSETGGFRLFNLSSGRPTSIGKLARVIAQAAAGNLIPATSSDGNPTNTFRYSRKDNQYVYNLSTKPLSVGRWRLEMFIDNGCIQTIDIRLAS